jgi:FkbM family methyltransferase
LLRSAFSAGLNGRGTIISSLCLVALSWPVHDITVRSKKNAARLSGSDWSFAGCRVILAAKRGLSTMRRFARRRLVDLLRWRGYDMKDRQTPLRRAPAFFRAMRPRGLAPQTVIDVGVGRGTGWLMDGFPDAWTVLVEPNDGFRPEIEAIMAARRGEVHYVAAGGEPGEATLNLNVRHPTSSTMSKVSNGQQAEYAKRGWVRETRAVTVPVRRLDSLNWQSWPKPFFLKIDAEGFELEVLKGATALLPHVQCMICEISVAQRYDGGYSFADFTTALDGHGFQLFDITDMIQFGRDGRLSTIDAAFVPKGSPLLSA